MNFVNRKGLLDVVSVFVQAKRFRGKINVQKPRAPHFAKALLFAATKPYYIKDSAKIADDLQCGLLQTNLKQNRTAENKLQIIYARELLDKFQSSQMIAIYHKNPMSAEVEFKAYSAFHKVNMEYKIYGKETLQMAIKGSPYETILNMYVSQNALLFSTEPDIKKMLRINKKFPQLVFLAAVYEGQFLNWNDVLKLSTLGNIQTARAELVQTINCAAQQLVQTLDANSQNLVSLLQSRSDQLHGKSSQENK